MTTKTDILHAVRAKCMDCSCYQPSEVRQCHLTTCPLWPFRLGVDPEPSPNRGFAKLTVYAAASDDGGTVAGDS